VGKNVAVFVDVANIFYAAKAAGVDIDYVTLLKSASAGRDLVRAYAYTGLDPDNENQRNFHDFLRRSNYKVVSKDIRKYGDGKVKANLDIELVVDMMKTARNLDIAIVVSGDGDFAPAIRAVQEMGVRCEVISFRGNTSSDLMEVADLFTDITQLARVERGSRSGRRVASDDDLSMTEVPDKQTDGTGAGRGRGGRGRSRTRTTETAAAAPRGRSRTRTTETAPSENGTETGLKALPGERLSKAVGSLTEADLAAAEVFTLDGGDDAPEAGVTDIDETTGAMPPVGDDETGEGQRRRRRRGGRGRGRGRGRDGTDAGSDAGTDVDREVVDEEIAAELYASEGAGEPESEPPLPSRPRTTPFGSVWDSQLGTSAAPSSAGLEPLPDDDDLDEPEIPEYLIAEQRRGTGGGRGGAGSGGGRGPRGGRSAYQSAMERERYGRGGGGGINRYPDVSGRTQSGSGREDRPPSRSRDERPPAADAPRRSSSEPWSDVPPELEAMLRAQVAGSATGQTTDRPDRTSAPADVIESTGDEAEQAPKRKTTRKPSTAKAKTAVAADAAVDDTAPPAPKKRATRSKAATTAADDEGAAAAAPKKRATRAKASTATKSGSADAADPSADAAPEAKPAPRKRTTKKAPAKSVEDGATAAGTESEAG
jgi:uncharacterized LabA/DUF88 family protein